MKKIDTLLIIVVLFVLFAWSRALLRFKDKAIRWTEFAFWTIIWGGIVLLTAFREKLSFLVRIFDIGRPVDIFVYSSIVLGLYLIFRLYVKVDENEQNMTKIIRELAIRGRKK